MRGLYHFSYSVRDITLVITIWWPLAVCKTKTGNDDRRNINKLYDYYLESVNLKWHKALSSIG